VARTGAKPSSLRELHSPTQQIGHPIPRACPSCEQQTTPGSSYQSPAEPPPHAQEPGAKRRALPEARLPTPHNGVRRPPTPENPNVGISGVQQQMTRFAISGCKSGTGRR
jgi:hypothetical protein